MRQAGIKPAGEPQQDVPALEAFPAGPETVAPSRPVVAAPTAPTPQSPVRPAEPQPPIQTAPPVGERKFAVAEKLVIHETATPGCVEQYRRVAATLHQLQEERGLKVLMVASAQVGEGKTLTAANLALTLSESYKRRVLLIDADLRRPSLSELFRIQRVAGLSESLQNGNGGPLRVFALSEWLSLLPSGRPTSDPMAGLTSGRMQQIIAEAAQDYDWVIVDTPPAALQPDASLLSTMVEGIVLVIGAGVSQSPVVQSAIDTIGRDKIIGVVLNRVDPALFDETEYYRYYYPQRSPTFSGGPASKAPGTA